jgi:hypothetical protein
LDHPLSSQKDCPNSHGSHGKILQRSSKEEEPALKTLNEKQVDQKVPIPMPMVVAAVQSQFAEE